MDGRVLVFYGLLTRAGSERSRFLVATVSWLNWAFQSRMRDDRSNFQDQNFRAREWKEDASVTASAIETQTSNEFDVTATRLRDHPPRTAREARLVIRHT